MMNDQEIIQKINSLGDWYYQFDLKGHLTPLHQKYRINRHQLRKRYIFEPLLQLCGGSLAGKRVLDLGCNAGFWSLTAIENGADFVLGIDARQLHLDQANFVFETKEIAKEKYKFLKGNVFQINYKEHGNFDIVLCMGLFYHINKPISLLELISPVNPDILVIDTIISHLPIAALEMRNDDIKKNITAFDYSLVMRPTKLALIKMAEQFGYSVAILKPRFKKFNASSRDYYGHHRAFLCAKQTDLHKIKTITESISSSSRLGEFLVWFFRYAIYQRFLHLLGRK
jgi:tRNA (mo5U34)-methyltransferase